jgi:hypothetical protein
MTTRPHPSEFLCANSDPILPARCAQIFQDFLTGRGDPSGELDQVLDQNPELVFGHCLRAAIVVRGDHIGAR